MAETVLPPVRAHQPLAADGGEPAGVLMPTTLVGRMVAAPIVAYRRWISPALPPTCRFYPSCSEYALTAVAVHGPLKGIGLTIWRLLRCQPFHPGGIDYVPAGKTSSVPLRREHAHHPAPLDTLHRER